MLMALQFSQQTGLLSKADVTYASSIIERAGLPMAAPEEVSDAEQVMSLMAHDKKVTAGKLRLILLRKLGEAFLTDDFDRQALKHSIAAML